MHGSKVRMDDYVVKLFVFLLDMKRQMLKTKYQKITILHYKSAVNKKNKKCMYAMGFARVQFMGHLLWHCDIL